jgi:hypothetical protein
MLVAPGQRVLHPIAQYLIQHLQALLLCLLLVAVGMAAQIMVVAAGLVDIGLCQ